MMNIIMTMFAMVLFFGKPVAAIVTKINKVVSAKKEEKRAYERAMERYMQMHAMDIEH